MIYIAITPITILLKNEKEKKMLGNFRDGNTEITEPTVMEKNIYPIQLKR